MLFKEGGFEDSSLTCHCTELGILLQHKVVNRPVLFIYSDGGPDFSLTLWTPCVYACKYTHSTVIDSTCSI